MKNYPQNFVYPEINETDRTYAGVTGPVLREDGDWRDYLPFDEDQRVNGVESSACYIESQQAGIAVLQEERYGLLDRNYSARFNALLSDGGENGGDPIKGAKSIKYDGLIPELIMPFANINSWNEYHSWKGANEADCRRIGKDWLTRWEPKYKIVAEREEPLDTKYLSLREALKRGPVMVSVHAWYERNGLYYKPQGKRDTHLTLAVYLDEQNRIYARDTYAPYLKILEPNTNFEFAMTWTVEKQATKEEIGIFLKMLQAISNFLSQWKPETSSKATILTSPTITSTAAPQPLVEPPKYDWDTPVLARHSVRVIADEEGLTVEQKDTMCATIGAESGWRPGAVGKPNSNGTRDYGIVQVNSYWWIGVGKQFPSTDYVLTHPEECVRWMCKLWKQGKRNYWSAWNNGSYKKYL